MLFVNLGPLGTLQLYQAFDSGYWSAREIEFFEGPLVRLVEWLRLPGDLIFIVGGILPVVYLAVRMFTAAPPLRHDAGRTAGPVHGGSAVTGGPLFAVVVTLA